VAVEFCGTCGQPLVPDQLFCQHCGSRVDENATRADTPPPPGITVSSTGTLYCGACGALVGSQDRLCRRCGAPVESLPGLVSDPSLHDAPTIKGTPFPQGYQTPPTPRDLNSPLPGYASQPPPAWGASQSPGSLNQPPGFFADQPRPGVQTPPYGPPRPAVPPSQRRQRWPLALAIVLVALALIAGGGLFLVLHQSGGNPQGNGGTPTPAPGVTQTSVGVTPSTTPVVLTTATAKMLIQQYYDDINATNYDAAYDLLSPEYQQGQTRQGFKDGFKNTILDTLTINSAEQLSNGTIQVDIHLQAQETTGVSNYAGYYIVTKENGKLLILSADLKKQ
jgi:Double zinc ribbon